MRLKQKNRNTDPMGRQPKAAPVFLIILYHLMGRPPKGRRPIQVAAEGGASVFFVSAHLFVYIMNIYRYSLYIPSIFHIYIYI